MEDELSDLSLQSVFYGVGYKIVNRAGVFIIDALAKMIGTFHRVDINLSNFGRISERTILHQ